LNVGAFYSKYHTVGIIEEAEQLLGVLLTAESHF